MKKILLSSVALLGLTATAMAADLLSRRAAPAPIIAAVPVFTWTGFFLGVNAGYGWTRTTHRHPSERRHSSRARTRAASSAAARLATTTRSARSWSARSRHPYADIGGDFDFGLLGAWPSRISTTTATTSSALSVLAPVWPSTAPSSTSRAASPMATSAASAAQERRLDPRRRCRVCLHQQPDGQGRRSVCQPRPQQRAPGRPAGWHARQRQQRRVRRRARRSETTSSTATKTCRSSRHEARAKPGPFLLLIPLTPARGATLPEPRPRVSRRPPFDDGYGLGSAGRRGPRRRRRRNSDSL